MRGDGFQRFANYENASPAGFFDDVRCRSTAATFPYSGRKVSAGRDPSGLPFIADNSGSMPLWRSGSLLQDRPAGCGIPRRGADLGCPFYPPPRLHPDQGAPFLDDGRPQEIGTSARCEAALVGELGGTPISVRPLQLYGDAAASTPSMAPAMSWAAFEPFNLQEVTSYHVEIRFGGGSGMFFMSRKKFDALPPEALERRSWRRAVEPMKVRCSASISTNRPRVAAVDRRRHAGQAQDRGAARGARSKSWREKGLGLIVEDWIKTRPGGDGQKVFDTYQELIAKAQAGR